MRLRKYLQTTSNVFENNRLLKFVIVIIAGAEIFNSFMVYRAVSYQKVILIPPKMTGTIEFVKGKPTDKYIWDMTRTITNLAVNYSPATARAQFNELLEYFAPEKFPNASEKWYSLASRIEETQACSVFYLENITLKKDGTVEIFGEMRQFVGNTSIFRQGKTFVLSYRIEKGRFYLLNFKEKEKQTEKEKGVVQ